MVTLLTRDEKEKWDDGLSGAISRGDVHEVRGELIAQADCVVHWYDVFAGQCLTFSRPSLAADS